jgi:hypothetical protein
MHLLQIVLFSFTMWFGLYLLARDARKPGLRFAGLGLVSYAVGLGATLLLGYAPDMSATLDRWQHYTLLLPAVFWIAAVLHLLPSARGREINTQLMMALTLLGAAALASTALDADLARLLLTVIPVGFALWALLRVWGALRHADLPRQPLAALFTATLFFTLGAALLLLPAEIIASEWLLLGISVDLLLLGYAIGVLDAYDEGTSLLPGALRSLLAAALAVGVIGGQVGLLMLASGQVGLPLVLLLLSTITTVIALEVFGDGLQALLDRLIFARRIRQQRADLRAVNNALPQTDDSIAFDTLSDDEFARLTRRALSHYNDLNKLAASPLTRLPVIDARLTTRGGDASLLDRTAELKRLLRETIEALKPDGDKTFATGDEWRYYNVLYFPYIVGMKPYSRRAAHDDLTPDQSAALDWFQTYVPERTLYNWQTTASKLVAARLRELTPPPTLETPKIVPLRRTR